ncbi:dimethylamine monooxygenase subunit DmmA family protein [Raineyella fluvialis]|uniref:Dimethylamine monooxygenase subunit DmmA-like C-terminal domain-containing protein n=1 Tax=Raineyella fluvialis TaxID=2662261 RepID=A0A5Q2FB09_9ACTN|nr:dimethylamine monooxygenase subunit DmmA family protein [Raineyella fluvialis]QGF24052.1 hypothetical protein Rai3103_10575 [Raineyella fluvialis]
MADLAHTSVPTWVADAPGAVTPDRTGSTWILVGAGTDGVAQTERWRDALLAGGASVQDIRVLHAAGGRTENLGAALTTALGQARVGVRVALAGPVGACLALRGVAVRAGTEDDELVVAPVGTGPLDIHCCHCLATTPAVAAIGDVVTCDSCGRRLVIYHHVSRRTGRLMGYQIDAEEATHG